jgi:hypothetical protein
MRKENVADPEFTADDRLFAPMNANGCSAVAGIAFAIPLVSFEPVYSAIPGTQCAAFQFMKHSRDKTAKKTG